MEAQRRATGAPCTRLPSPPGSLAQTRPGAGGTGSLEIGLTPAVTRRGEAASPGEETLRPGKPRPCHTGEPKAHSSAVPRPLIGLLFISACCPRWRVGGAGGDWKGPGAASEGPGATGRGPGRAEAPRTTRRGRQSAPKIVPTCEGAGCSQQASEAPGLVSAPRPPTCRPRAHLFPGGTLGASDLFPPPPPRSLPRPRRWPGSRAGLLSCLSWCFEFIRPGLSIDPGETPRPNSLGMNQAAPPPAKHPSSLGGGSELILGGVGSCQSHQGSDGVQGEKPQVSLTL